MAVEQAVSTGLEALKLIVSGGIGAAIIGIIGKVFVDRKLQEQKAVYDKQLESLKSELGKKNTVHKLQFEKEFQLYGELWKALVVVRKTVVIGLDLETSDKLSYEKQYEKAVGAFSKAKNLFEDNRPFYHDTVSKLTRELVHQCRKHLPKVDKMLKSKKDDDDLSDSAEELLKKVPKAIDEIEEAIQGRIEILQKAEIVE